jgi:hypothetical protein
MDLDRDDLDLVAVLVGVLAASMPMTIIGGCVFSGTCWNTCRPATPACPRWA